MSVRFKRTESSSSPDWRLSLSTIDTQVYTQNQGLSYVQMERLNLSQPLRGTRRRAEVAPDGEPVPQRRDPPNVQMSSHTNASTSNVHTHPIIRGTPYFKDGNLILQVGHTQFRVYKSILERESEAIAGMFVAAHAERERDCDIIRLQGDSPSEWAHVLTGMFDKRFVFVNLKVYLYPFDQTLDITRKKDYL